MGIFFSTLSKGVIAFLTAGFLTAGAKPPPFMPVGLLRLDPSLSHHVILVEKSNHRLFIYENRDSYPHLTDSFSVATGKFSGNKRFQGDKKTPEGIYRVTQFLSSQELLQSYGKAGEIYGIGAFVLSYPNPVDLIRKKTGSGIWLHATNDNSRISAGTDSRGCVVTTDQDLMTISQFIELGKTPFIITEENHFISRENWIKKRKQLDQFFQSWLQSWKDENFKQYISHYHRKNYSDHRRKTYAAFRNYKRAVFSQRGKPLIKASHLSILREKDQIMIQFIQDYQSENISDKGKKILYLKQNESYEWKIVNEAWFKIKDPEDAISFTPSQRFFIRQAKN